MMITVLYMMVSLILSLINSEYVTLLSSQAYKTHHCVDSMFLQVLLLS